VSLIVQKFGGSSVRDAERVMNVARRVIETYKAGNDVVVVVSAQGDTTDDLIDKAKEINPKASKREMDMLLSTGEQISIALLAMATVREVFGAGTFAGIEIPFMIDHKIEILVKAPGGLMVYGLLIALVNVITKGKAIKKKEFNCAGCPSAGVCNGGCKANEVKEGE
jgi:hypothetical protein